MLETMFPRGTMVRASETWEERRYRSKLFEDFHLLQGLLGGELVQRHTVPTVFRSKTACVLARASKA